MMQRGLFRAATSPLPEGAELMRDLSYGAHPAQRLDLYRPAGSGPWPVTVFVHGGGWQHGDKAMPRIVGHKARHWLAHGRALAVINYRLLPQVDVLGQVDDVAQALAFVQRKARKLTLATSGLALVGHSAGAHLAALLAVSPQRAATFGLQAWRATVILDTAALDMVSVMQRPHFAFYDPVFGSDPAFWQTTSPTRVMQQAPLTPMLIVHSAWREDAAMAAQCFARRAAGLGGWVRVLPLPLGHLALNQGLGLDHAYTAAIDAFVEEPERGTSHSTADPPAENAVD